MSKSSARSAIRLRGVRHNNLKNFDLDLPLNQLIVVTGLSGSGKSSLAFDTLFAEGQRRYIETFSPYARQFLDRMDKPQVDSIEGIPPAIAIEQRNSVRTTRSTVGTMTEICDYMKVLWPHLAQLHCRNCGKPVRKDSPQQIWDWFKGPKSEAGNGSADLPERGSSESNEDLLITFDVPLSDKLTLQESLTLVSKQGYQRVLIGGRVLRLDEALNQMGGQTPGSPLSTTKVLTIIQDRLRPSPATRPRFIEACEQAYHFGKGKLSIRTAQGPSKELSRFSNRLHCAACDIEYKQPSSALFSFNHPLGACSTCRGFGRIITIDYERALPDKSKTLAQGVVKPWQSGQSAECQEDLMKSCRRFKVPTDVPFEKLAQKWQDLVINGEPDYGKDAQHQWPHAWYGVKGYFRWLESKAYKMHVRVLLSRYRAYRPCPACGGLRFQPEALLYRVDFAGAPATVLSRAEGPLAPTTHASMTLADFYRLPIRQALELIEQLKSGAATPANDPLKLALAEVRARLGYLNEVGLGYLTLDRPTRSLSGGETERVSLTTCLGTRLVNTLFVLDEPSVGLHPRDTDRLIEVLKQLRDAGNTVLVVEHEAAMMRAADQIVDLGPGHGAAGGQVVFQGKYCDVLSCSQSLTGRYLSGKSVIEIPPRRPVNLRNGEDPNPPTFSRRNGLAADSGLILKEAPATFLSSDLETPSLTVSGAKLHNLKNLTVKIPLERFVCVTGVSGSGKTTFVREVLLPALANHLDAALPALKASDLSEPESSDELDGSEESGVASIEGAEHLSQVVLVDQSILGKTPRSNPAVYIGAFEHIRELFAQSEAAKRRGLNASAFSFNSSQGQCERCRGAGFEKIEMQFLSDVFIRCPECDGKRYRSHILEINLAAPGQRAFSIAELLDATVDEAIAFLKGLDEFRSARRAVDTLALLQETGLGYLKLGQPINTLSGGESQRLKLVKHLADCLPAAPGQAVSASTVEEDCAKTPILFLFDEPTTGLHFDDVRVLLKVFQRLVDAGHSLLVIEHNLDVIRSCDWIIDLGPEAGDQGGWLVAEGTPETVSQCAQSHTGRALRQVLSGNQALAGKRSRMSLGARRNSHV